MYVELQMVFQCSHIREFHTSIACYKGGWLYRLAKGPLKEFRRREYSAYLKPYTKQVHGWI